MRPTPIKAADTRSLAPLTLPVNKDVVRAAPVAVRKFLRLDSVDIIVACVRMISDVILPVRRPTRNHSREAVQEQTRYRQSNPVMNPNRHSTYTIASLAMPSSQSLRKL